MPAGELGDIFMQMLCAHVMVDTEHIRASNLFLRSLTLALLHQAHRMLPGHRFDMNHRSAFSSVANLRAA